MENIPAHLVKSLNDLGLSNNEALVYAALVLYDNAEAKEIIEFLSISKPSVYEALDHLADMGLAVKRITKPARYSAISPVMAINLLRDKLNRAADKALIILKQLESEKVKTDKEDALWTIYGDANIEYKIRDLFGKAKSQIRCMIGERYLPFIENCRMGDVSFRLIVISDSSDLEKKLHGLFPGKNAEIHVIPSEKFLAPPPFAPPEFEEAKKFMNFENTLELIIDDEELLMIPPFISGSVSVLNTKNKGAILQIKMFSEFHWRRLVEREEFPLPPASFRNKPRK
ncbi:helix-turn-helix domain-containing protein [uncultured Methanoregula sp.]|uniref:TrmB family transcriptional regulator n=1 Tax=uncultured Methanoregula sp. TaxID=1005933 RepID=UPI002AAC13AF|nr:helix-turn-helix domain-containing protein [uncultured Methanoregula sp.]